MASEIKIRDQNGFRDKDKGPKMVFCPPKNTKREWEKSLMQL